MAHAVPHLKCDIHSQTTVAKVIQPMALNKLKIFAVYWYQIFRTFFINWAQCPISAMKKMQFYAILALFLILGQFLVMKRSKNEGF